MDLWTHINDNFRRFHDLLQQNENEKTLLGECKMHSYKIKKKMTL